MLKCKAEFEQSPRSNFSFLHPSIWLGVIDLSFFGFANIWFIFLKPAKASISSRGNGQYRFVCVQATLYEAALSGELLSEQERGVLQWGRNAKVKSIPKRFAACKKQLDTYRKATAFECLVRPPCCLSNILLLMPSSTFFEAANRTEIQTGEVQDQLPSVKALPIQVKVSTLHQHTNCVIKDHCSLCIVEDIFHPSLMVNHIKLRCVCQHHILRASAEKSKTAINPQKFGWGFLLFT